MPARIRKLMEKAKLSHYRYKKKLQSNDLTWGKDLNARREAQLEYKRQVASYRAQSAEESKLEQQKAGANDAWDMVRKLKTATRHKENPQPELDMAQIQQ